MCCPFQFWGIFLPTSWVQHCTMNPTVEVQLLLYTIIYTISHLYLLTKSLWCKTSICNLPIFFLQENTADQNNWYVQYYTLDEANFVFLENITVRREQFYILIMSAGSWCSAAEGSPHYIQIFILKYINC